MLQYRLCLAQPQKPPRRLMTAPKILLLLLLLVGMPERHEMRMRGKREQQFAADGTDLYNGKVAVI